MYRIHDVQPFLRRGIPELPIDEELHRGLHVKGTLDKVTRFSLGRASGELASEEPYSSNDAPRKGFDSTHAGDNCRCKGTRLPITRSGQEPGYVGLVAGTSQHDGDPTHGHGDHTGEGSMWMLLIYEREALRPHNKRMTLISPKDTATWPESLLTPGFDPCRV
jgi:hypothetical protein